MKFNKVALLGAAFTVTSVFPMRHALGRQRKVSSQIEAHRQDFKEYMAQKAANIDLELSEFQKVADVTTNKASQEQYRNELNVLKKKRDDLDKQVAQLGDVHKSEAAWIELRNNVQRNYSDLVKSLQKMSNRVQAR